MPITPMEAAREMQQQNRISPDMGYIPQQNGLAPTPPRMNFGPQLEPLSNKQIMGGQNQSTTMGGGGATGMPAMQMAEPQKFGEPNLAEMLASQAELASGSEEVSLSTLKKSEIDKIMRSVKQCRDIANDYYDSTVQPKVKIREDIFKASEKLYDKKFPTLSESTKWRSRDIKTVVDWIIPSLIDVFTGCDDPVDIKGVNVEDDDNAKKIQQLIKYQVQRKNNYFSFLEAILKSALTVNLGVAKVYWHKEEKRDSYEYLLDLNDLPMVEVLVAAVQNGVAEVTGFERLEGPNDFYKVEFDIVKNKESYPVIEYLPPSEFRFTPEGTNVQDCKFVAHRKIVQGDYLKRKEQDGVFENVDEALKDLGDNKHTSNEIEKNNELSNIGARLSDEDNASKEAELYECYIKVDYNNDGIYEDLIVHCVGDVALSIQENELGHIPLFPAMCEYDSGKIFPDEGYLDGLEQNQDLKTAFIRQAIIAVAKNNIPQKFVTKNVDLDALLAGEEVVICDDEGVPPSNNVFIPPAIQLSPITMELVNYAQSEIESQSGSTKYNQGLDSNSLNKTATGITAIMGAADKRIKLLAKQLAENFIIPMFKYIILLNKQYADAEQLIRLNSENVTINREELDVDFDFVINVGEGAGTKEAQMQYLMILIQQLYPVLEQKGLIDANSWYSVFKDLLEKMGLRNTSNYVVDPNSEAGKMALQQKAQEAQQQLQMQMQTLMQQKQFDLEKAKISKWANIKFEDLPLDAQVDTLRKLGVNATPKSMAIKDAMINAKNNQRATSQTTGRGSKP